MIKLKNKRGAGSGLALIMILIVALIVAYLVMTQMSFLGVGGSHTANPDTQEEYVDEAQDAVNALNDRRQESLEIVEGEE